MVKDCITESPGVIKGPAWKTDKVAFQEVFAGVCNDIMGLGMY
jgi:hypothetical protein